MYRMIFLEKQTVFILEGINMSGLWIIVPSILGLFILYIIIETAVRRGIDASETNRILMKILENQKRILEKKE